MYQLALYVGLGDQEYVVIIDTDDHESQPNEFVRTGFKLQEVVDVTGDLSGFPVGYELTKR